MVITEGAIDCMRALDAGIPCVALLTSCIIREKIEQIKQMKLEKVVICLDNDKAGREGAYSLHKALSECISNVSVYTFDDEGCDLDSFLLAGNTERLRKFIFSS